MRVQGEANIPQLLAWGGTTYPWKTGVNCVNPFDLHADQPTHAVAGYIGVLALLWRNPTERVPIASFSHTSSTAIAIHNHNRTKTKPPSTMVGG